MNLTTNRCLLAFALTLVSLGPLGCSSSSTSAAPGDGGPGDAALDQAANTDADAGSSVLSIAPLSTVPGSAHEHEPFIAVSPAGRVAVSFTSFLTTAGEISVGYRISNDRGETWGRSTLVALPTGHNEQANASVAAGDDDTLYMSWGAEEHTNLGRSGQGVYVASSPPGTTSFGTPVLVTDPTVPVAVYDQPRVSVTHAGVINLSYNETSADGLTSWIQNARSTDGKTWTRSYAAGPGAYGSFRNEARFCRPAGEGRIFMTYLDTDVAYYANDVAVALRSSDDDGATWSTPIDVTSETDELIVDASANLGCVTNGSDVWIYYGLTPEENLVGTVGGGSAPSSDFEPTMTRIRIAHSSDRGGTIDSRTDVLDTSVGTRAMYPVLVGEGDGTLDLSYYTGRFDDDPNGALRRTRSTDGKTFAPTARVYAPITLETNRLVPQWIGDYLGGAFQGGDLFLVFTDNASATPHVAFTRMPPALPGGDSMGEPDASAPLSDAGDPGACYTAAAFKPVTWAPPTAFGQGACSAAQVAAYLACYGAGDCTAFHGDASNAACLGCLETDESAPAHGPFVTTASDAGVTVVEVNLGGCQAHFDGKTGGGSCGQQANNANDCVNFECGGCSDFLSPSADGPTYECYYLSTETGVCASYLETRPCGYETLDGGAAAACTDLSSFVPSWCGD